MTNKFLKKKRIIAFLLIFTLSFGVISDYNKKETQAAFVIDDITIILLGLTVLATGVVATSDLQIKDMGSKVWNHLVQAGVNTIDAITKLDLKGNRHLLMNDVVLDSAMYVAQNLPITKTKSELINGKADFVKSPTVWLPVDQSNIEQAYKFTFVDLPTNVLNFKYTFPNASTSSLRTYTLPAGATSAEVVFSMNPSTNYMRYYVVSDSYNSGWINISARSSQVGIFEYDGNIIGKHIFDIDYSNSIIKDGYNETVINERIPWNRGIDELGNATSIGTIASNSPVIDKVINKDITQDVPLQWDDVKDGFTEKTIEGDKVIDKTIDDTIDDTIDIDIPQELNLWSWLGNILKAILEAIKTIIGTLFGFLDNLINALKNLFLWLFAPTVTISELFNVPTGTGFGAIIDLFNWNSIWSIEPQPYTFKTNMAMTDLSNSNSSKNWDIELNIFDNVVVKNNINLVRNVLSYSLLLSVIYFIVYHFLPQRDMD